MPTDLPGTGVMAMMVNNDAGCLGKRVVWTFLAGKLTPNRVYLGLYSGYSRVNDAPIRVLRAILPYALPDRRPYSC